MTSVVYAWRRGSRFKADPAAAHAEWEALRERNPRGALEVDDMVEAARSPNSACHEDYEWDDRRAAMLQRRATATSQRGALIVVHVREDPERPVSTPAYLPVEVEEKRNDFLPAEEVLAVTEYRDEVLKRAKRDLAAWVRRYESLKELADLVAAAREFIGE